MPHLDVPAGRHRIMKALPPRALALSTSLVLAITASSATAFGEDTEEIPFADPLMVPLEPSAVGPFEIGLHGDLTLWADTFERPADQGRGGGLYHRTRAGGFGRFHSLSLHAEADLAAGRFAGAGIPTPPPVGDHGARPFHPAFDALPQSIDPRQLYLQWESPVGQLQAGLQTSQWGLGLVANDGAQDDYFFGMPFGGDRALRVLFATAPLRPAPGPDFLDDIFLVVGADRVFRDENADWLAGDEAYQAITSLFWQGDQGLLGGYAAYRDQTDRDGSTLRILAMDLAAQGRWTTDDDIWSFSLAAEGAYLLGETTRADGPDLTQPIHVEALGLATHGEIRHNTSGIATQLRAGFASGDSNPRNQNLHRFRFDPNYRAGLLLFDHHIPAWTQHSVDGAADELTLRDTPRGIDNLVESGSISNALFIHPLILWGATDDLTFATGFLTGVTHRSLRDLRATFEAGGDPVGVAGRPRAGRWLGWEAQAGVRYQYQVWNSLTLAARAEGAFLVPGEVFEDATFGSDAPTALLRAYLSAHW